MNLISSEGIIWLSVYLMSLAAADIVSFYFFKSRKGKAVTLAWWAVTLAIFAVVLASPFEDQYLRLFTFLIAASKIQNTSDVAFKKVATPLRSDSLFEFLQWSASPPDTVIAQSSPESNLNRNLGKQRLKVGALQLLPGIALFILNFILSFKEISFFLFYAYVGAIILLLPSGFFRVVMGLYMVATGNYVKPMFNNPLASASIHDFWSKRWNLMYMRSALRTVFRPLIKKGYRPQIATMAVFICSGISHEVLIYAIRGYFDGYNGSFFVLQGLAVCLERQIWPKYSRVNKHIRRIVTMLWFGLTGPMFVKAFAEMFTEIF